MKKFVVVALAVALLSGIGVQTASAENSLSRGSVALNVETSSDPMISVKYMLASDFAILAGIELGVRGGDNDGTDIGMEAGVRKYLKVGDFAPFVGARLMLKREEPGKEKVTEISIQGEGGAEVFLHKNLSLEGAIRLGFAHTTTKDSASKTKESYLGAYTTGLAINFYFF